MPKKKNIRIQQTLSPNNAFTKQRNIWERTFFDKSPIIYFQFSTQQFIVRCRVHLYVTQFHRITKI